MNIVKKLRNCPKGTKLYSPIFGDCFFDYIDSNDSIYQINVRAEERIVSFTADGRYFNNYKGECMLFPSKDNRDWSTFKIQKEYEFKPFDKVLVRNREDPCWRCSLFSHIEYIEGKRFFRCIHSIWRYCIPYEGNQELLGTCDEPKCK